ncbi:MAG TPA: tyrosine--tRNA ligase [Cytophagales bacterium]|nr:tyrosine--tRNA ligase [Cytophagales bacterium]
MINRNFVEELKWRGMIQDIMPGTEALLNKEMIVGYIGFDPTADSLGVGNLVQIMTLLHFQQSGHKPLALVGGATGMVGDPSGKSQERNLLDESTLQHNLSCQKKQLERFLDFDCGANSAEIVNNYDWFKDFNFLEFIRDVGKYISVNYMMAKDSVKNRLENGMSFTEFTYQLIQGFDFYHLWKHRNVKLQMGGSDQWGNIVTGTELIRRKGNGEAFALTTPLIKKSDGTKFGKSEGGNVWLDPKKTSPYKFYQFWLNSSDEDVKKYIRIFTLFDRKHIEALEAENEVAPHLRVLQKALAKDITIRVHSEDDYLAAVEASEILFGKGTLESLERLSEEDFLSVFAGVPTIGLSKEELGTQTNVTDLLSIGTQSIIFSSKGEARKMIQQGGVGINKTKIEDPGAALNFKLLSDKYLLVQKGKKNYYIIHVI